MRKGPTLGFRMHRLVALSRVALSDVESYIGSTFSAFKYMSGSNRKIFASIYQCVGILLFCHISTSHLKLFTCMVIEYLFLTCTVVMFDIHISSHCIVI
jgi:hypothetical protein